MTLNHWLHATRPRTLPVGVSAVITGIALAVHLDGFHALSAGLALITAMCLQIAANFANDALDFRRGADSAARVGPQRLTSSGLVSMRTMLAATGVVLVLAVACGLYLVIRGGWVILLLGLLSLICAVAYTGGPFPIAYKGLGEVFVFVFFGPVAVAGTAYVQMQDWEWQMFWVSVPVGLIACATLVVNNLRDRISDAQAGKMTIAVRIGAAATIWQYRLLWVIGLGSPVVFFLVGWLNWSWALMLLAVPGVVQLWLRIARATGPALNPVLGATAQQQLIYCALLSSALIVS